MSGLLVAGATAAVSGVSVFVNSYGVHAVPSPAVYTTAKNLVAAIVLVGVALAVRLSARGPRAVADVKPTTPPRTRLARLVGLGYVGTVGGGLAFILFFDGLARTSAVPAAFLHDTLVVWVALVAWPLLGERLGRWNVAAIVLLVVGVVASTGGIGGIRANSGNALVLGATLCWAIETVVARRLLTRVTPTTLGLVRMGGGAVVLLAYLAISGALHSLIALDASALRWTLVTGVLLGAYVATWMTALARARAIDVTSVLVSSAVITTILQALVQHKGLGPEAVGITLMLIGTAAATVGWARVART